ELPEIIARLRDRRTHRGLDGRSYVQVVQAEADHLEQSQPALGDEIVIAHSRGLLHRETQRDLGVLESARERLRRSQVEARAGDDGWLSTRCAGLDERARPLQDLRMAARNL